MLLIKYVGHKGLRILTDCHLGRHLENFKTLNDARVASVGFINYNASTTRINKEKNFKIKFQIILIFHWTIMYYIRDRRRKRRPNDDQHLNFHLHSTFCLPKSVHKILKTLAPIGAEKSVKEISFGEKEK